MKYYFLALILCLYACDGRPKKPQTKPITQDTTQTETPIVKQEKTLTETIQDVLKAYAKQDEQGLNKLVNPKWGIYIVHRPGATDNFTIIDSFSFKHPEPNYYAYEPFSTTASLQIAALPSFDCGTEKWSKEGLFCDTTSHPEILSQIAKFQQQYNDATYPAEELKKIALIEPLSYRIIATGKDYSSFIFHLSLWEGKWYLSLLDRAYGGCDA